MRNSGITGYNLFSRRLTISNSWRRMPFGSGSGPQCMVEDPSDQFIYTANFDDSTITGRALEPQPTACSTTFV